MAAVSIARATSTALARVRIVVLDVQGRTIATLVDGERPAGRHDVRWEAAAEPAGVYFVRLEAEGRRFVRRLARPH